MSLRTEQPRQARRPWQRPAVAVAAVFAVCALIVLVAVAVGPPGGSATTGASALSTNPDLDPGTPLYGRAPGFTLTDQFGRAVSLRSSRGRVVLLAFTDAQCTTVCPLTTSAMAEAKGLLGAAGDAVELLGVDA